jgi:hypothetical protein
LGSGKSAYTELGQEARSPDPVDGSLGKEATTFSREALQFEQRLGSFLL